LVAVPAMRILALENERQAHLDGIAADRKLLGAVTSSAIASFRAMAECREGVTKMLEEYSDQVASRFIAAKVAWVFGRPSEAIGTLEDLITNKGGAMSRQFQLPVTIEGNFWVGTISRHFGDANRARTAYSEIVRRAESDQELRGLAVLCYLYQAEIEYQASGNKEPALALLGKAKSIEEPPAPRGRYNVLSDLLDYQTRSLVSGVEGARLTLKGNGLKTEDCVLFAVALLEADGVSAEPAPDFYIGERQLLLDASLESAIECRTSPIDRSLAQLVLGWLCERREDSPRAEKYYGDLFAGDSFFAPEGGIHLARVQRKQGKAADAARTFAKVKELFPGYANLADELSRQSTGIQGAQAPTPEPSPAPPTP